MRLKQKDIAFGVDVFIPDISIYWSTYGKSIDDSMYEFEDVFVCSTHQIQD